MTGHTPDRRKPPGSSWKRWLWSAGAAVVLLSTVAMQVTDEVNWGPEDFGFAAALLIGAGGVLELVARRAESRYFRAAVGVALATAFILVWSNAALGIIGSEDNPVNLIFFGVLAVGLIGALLSRLEPEGMAIALAATAAAQALAGLVALLAADGLDAALDALGLTIFFCAPWLLSARLFQKAAEEQDSLSASPRA